MNELNLLLKDIENKLKKRYVPLIYLEQFRELLMLKDMKDILALLRKYDIPEVRYNRNLINLEKLFPERKKGINYLRSLYEEYKKILKQAEVENTRYYLNVAKKILETGYSIEEHCDMTGEYKLHELREIIGKIKVPYRQVYYELTSLSYQNKAKFYKHITSIIYEIKNSDKFDLFDYYYLTKLHPSEFLSVCSEFGINMSEKDMVEVRVKIRQLTEKDKVTINKDAELEGTTIISGIEVSREEKEKVFNLLEDLNIPNTAYKTTLRRYLNKDDKIMNSMGIEKVK